MMKHLAKSTRPVNNTENTPRVKKHKADLQYLREKIAYDEDLFRMVQSTFIPVLYGIQPQDGYLPYFEFEKPSLDSRLGVYAPQQFFYGICIRSEQYRRTDAMMLRDWLFYDLANVVRMAYITPSEDGVYLVCGGFLHGGRSMDDFIEERQAAEGAVSSYLMARLLRFPQMCDCVVFPCEWAYITSDAGVKYRAQRILNEDAMYNATERLKQRAANYSK